jgi:glycine hydroxymethyltransferase
MVPFDDKSPFVTSGIRIGAPAITTRGLKVEDMKEVVGFIDEAIQNADNDEALHEIGERVSMMMSSHRLFVM